MTPQSRRPIARRAVSRGLVLLTVIGSCGCKSVTSDVRDYYQQMAYNYKEAKEKAKIQEMSLENESKMLLATGDKNHYRRTQRELDRIKGWEEKCGKQEERFQKAAHWTEEHFHLDHAGKAVDRLGEAVGSSGMRLESPPPSGSGTSMPALPAESGSQP